MEYEEYVTKYTNNILSFSDKIVNFEASINQMKSIYTLVKTNFRIHSQCEFGFLRINKYTNHQQIFVNISV